MGAAEVQTHPQQDQRGGAAWLQGQQGAEVLVHQTRILLDTSSPSEPLPGSLPVFSEESSTHLFPQPLQALQAGLLSRLLGSAHNLSHQKALDFHLRGEVKQKHSTSVQQETPGGEK